MLFRSIFPGEENGPMTEYYVHKAIEDMSGADIAIDIHASNIFLKELPQVRISEETADELVPLALQLNIDFIWVSPSATVLESTLAHSLNTIGTSCIVVEMGVGMRLTQEYSHQLTEGILNLMKTQGMWAGETITPRPPILSNNDVDFINADAAGIFMAAVPHKIGRASCRERVLRIV